MASLVLCFDGTGNEFRSRANTNVVLIHRAVERGPDIRMFYDPGVGTFPGNASLSGLRLRWHRLLGLAFGFGIKANICDGYRFLMDNWNPGDDIYLFGFSRGAYTARALAGMIRSVGLLPKGGANLVPYAMQVYWRRRPDSFELAGRFKAAFARHEKVQIAYVGLFDTVKTVGLWDALLQGFASKLRRVPPFRDLRTSLPYTAALPNVESGRHAVSIDERRTRFRTNLWFLDPARSSPDFEQTWFAGVHSDVGGGYHERELADIALQWVVEGAEAAGLSFDGSQLPVVTDENAAGKLHNSLIPIWWILGWRRRPIPQNASIHPSVLSRMETNPDYRPRITR